MPTTSTSACTHILLPSLFCFQFANQRLILLFDCLFVAGFFFSLKMVQRRTWIEIDTKATSVLSAINIVVNVCRMRFFFSFRIYTKANEYKIDLIGFQVRLIIICDFNMTIEMQTTKCSWNGETRPIKWKWDCLCASSQTPHIYKLLQEINGKNHNGKCYLHENGLISSFCMTIDKRLHEYAVATSQTAFSGYKRFYVSIWIHYCFQCNWYMLGIGCDRLALTSR